MRAIRDYIYVKTDKLYENEVDLAGQSIQIDTRFNEYENARIFGEVVSVPEGLSRSVNLCYDNDAEAAEINKSRWVSGDDLLKKAKEEEFWINKTYGQFQGQVSVSRDDYRSGPEAPKMVTLADLPMDIKVGDKAYYHYKSIRNKFDMHVDGYEVLQVRIDDIFCVVRDGEIIPQAGWVMVEPDMESWEDLTSEHGIIVSSERKARHLLGYVRHIGEPWSMDIKEANVGDKIVYEPESDWTVKIEGKDYYMMKQRDILAIVGDGVNTID